MIPGQKIYFVNAILFVIVKYFHVLTTKEIEIYFMPVIADCNHKSPFQIKGFDFLVQWHVAELFPAHWFIFFEDRKLNKRVLFQSQSASHNGKIKTPSNK